MQWVRKNFRWFSTQARVIAVAHQRVLSQLLQQTRHVPIAAMVEQVQRKFESYLSNQGDINRQTRLEALSLKSAVGAVGTPSRLRTGR